MQTVIEVREGAVMICASLVAHKVPGGGQDSANRAPHRKPSPKCLLDVFNARRPSRGGPAVLLRAQLRFADLCLAQNAGKRRLFLTEKVTWRSFSGTKRQTQNRKAHRAREKATRDHRACVAVAEAHRGSTYAMVSGGGARFAES